MKVYSYIDEYGIIISFTEKLLAPEQAKEYEVNHLDELEIVDNQIVINSDKIDSIELLKQASKKESLKKEIREKLLTYLIEKELKNIGLNSNLFKTEESYKQCLAEYFDLFYQ
jgi:translation elongation factor EF-4